MTVLHTQKQKSMKVCSVCSNNQSLKQKSFDQLPTEKNIACIDERGSNGYTITFDKPYETRDVLDCLRSEYELLTKTLLGFERRTEQEDIVYTLQNNSQPIFSVQGPQEGIVAKTFYVEFFDSLPPFKMKEHASNTEISELERDRPYSEPHYSIRLKVEPLLQ